jgi:hypothetical protein
MSSEVSTYIQTGVTIVAVIVYYLVYRFQSRKIDLLQKSVDSQSRIISDFEKYKSLFDVDDFEKRLKLKLDNQRIELIRSFEAEAVKLANNVSQKAAENFLQQNDKMLAAWNELAQIPLSIIMKEYPKKEDKQARDKYISEKFPKSADFFIQFCDDYLAGKVPPNS